MSSYASVKLAIDKYKEEAEEASLYQDWMKDQQDYRSKRSLWTNIGKAGGLALSMLFPGLGTAAGFAIGAGLGQAGGRLRHGTGEEALEFGGKFDTQGEREAEMAMEGAEYHWSDEMTAAMETAVQYYQLGGRFGKGGGTGSTTTSTSTTSPSNLWETFKDPQNWVPQATGAFLASAHGGFGGGGESQSSTSSSDESVTEDTVSPGYEDDTNEGYGGTSSDEEYQQWLASMGITSPIFNNNGLV